MKMLQRLGEYAIACILIVICTLTLLNLPAWSQACHDCQATQLPSPFMGNAVLAPDTFGNPGPSNDPWVIRKHVDEVNVFFTVTKGHKYIDDLQPNEVTVTDDRQPPARISYFGHQSDLPLRLSLVVDTSNSVHSRFEFEKDAASRFLRQIVRPQTDQAFVLGFSDKARLAQDYASEPEVLHRGIATLNSGGGTALFDAVQLACAKLANHPEDRPTARVLVLLSDGDDNASKSTLQQAIEDAQRKEVTIYSISTNNSGYQRPGDEVLRQLAVETGGDMFFPNNAKDTVKAFSAIEQEMRSRYALFYQPNDLSEDGRYHRIQIIVQRLRKKFRVHARKGYYALLTQ